MSQHAPVAAAGRDRRDPVLRIETVPEDGNLGLDLGMPALPQR